MPKTENIHDLLREIARSRDFEPKMLEQKVFVLWREHLGKPMDTQTVPISLSDGVLKVYTEYPVYVRELLFYKQKIIADLNAALGQPILTDLRIELRQLHKATPPHVEHVPADPNISKATASIPTSNNIHTPTAEESEQIEQVIADVTETDLKIALQQLFTTQTKEKP